MLRIPSTVACCYMMYEVSIWISQHVSKNLYVASASTAYAQARVNDILARLYCRRSGGFEQGQSRSGLPLPACLDLEYVASQLPMHLPW